MQTHQTECQHHQRESRAIVEPPFRSQAETQGVGLWAGLGRHARGQHRIGGRQDRAEQQRRTQRQP
jgi:hypothetical protein